MSLRPGDVLKKRYRIVKQLGQGGFGTVYRAEDLSLKTTCALKENLDNWEDAQRQFKREALLLAKLRHTNLPRVIDYFFMPLQGQYLVMDFVEGYNLQEIIERVKHPLFEKEVLDWIDQICDALIYLHSQTPPIIHRDVKPANIKITPSGKAMLVDFGVAKIYDPNIKTTIGARAVTPGYSPVEQYGHGSTDTRADIYALGATLYALLTGKRPPESIARITGDVLEPPSQLNPSISHHVERSILKAMEILAPNRYSMVADLRETLKKPITEIRDIEQEWREPTNQRNTSPISASSAQVSRPVSTPLSQRIQKEPTLLLLKAAAQPEWITISAGEFSFGEGRRNIYLPAFQLAKFPVTNLQYKYFLDANPRLLAPMYWKERDFPLGKGRHPVVDVSLHDAMAFCQWLDCRLPTEEEWEKAARGSDGRTYSWGDSWLDGKYCNNWDAKIGGTTPVDRYPEGISPYGVWDMVGNVWEWTADEYQGPFMHSLRGGSWRLFGKFTVRLTCGDWLTLDDTRDDLGFRCARSI